MIAKHIFQNTIRFLQFNVSPHGASTCKYMSGITGTILETPHGSADFLAPSQLHAGDFAFCNLGFLWQPQTSKMNPSRRSKTHPQRDQHIWWQSRALGLAGAVGLGVRRRKAVWIRRFCDVVGLGPRYVSPCVGPLCPTGECVMSIWAYVMLVSLCKIWGSSGARVTEPNLNFIDRFDWGQCIGVLCVVQTSQKGDRNPL
jgi:hypothetical protein